MLPRKLLVPRMRRKFIETIGLRASVALDAYENTPADSEKPVEDGGLAVAQKIGEILLENNSILVAVSHAENLDDVGVNQGPVALAAATKRTRLIRKVGTNLSKTLTRENYKGKPVPHLFKFFGNIYLTIPDTASLPRWGIPDEAIKLVVGGGLRAMMRDIDDGAAMVMAPTGKAMQQNPQTEDGRNAEGPKSLYMSSFSESSSRVMEKFTYFMAAASWGDNVSISSIYSLPDWKELEQERGRRLSKVEKTGIMVVYLNLIRSELAQHTANAAQMPVTYDSVPENGKPTVRKTALPNHNL